MISVPGTADDALRAAENRQEALDELILAVHGSPPDYMITFLKRRYVGLSEDTIRNASALVGVTTLVNGDDIDVILFNTNAEYCIELLTKVRWIDRSLLTPESITYLTTKEDARGLTAGDVTQRYAMWAVFEMLLYSSLPLTLDTSKTPQIVSSKFEALQAFIASRPGQEHRIQQLIVERREHEPDVLEMLLTDGGLLHEGML